METIATKIPKPIRRSVGRHPVVQPINVNNSPFLVPSSQPSRSMLTSERIPSPQMFRSLLSMAMMAPSFTYAVPMEANAMKEEEEEEEPSVVVAVGGGFFAPVNERTCSATFIGTPLVGRVISPTTDQPPSPAG